MYLVHNGKKYDTFGKNTGKYHDGRLMLRNGDALGNRGKLPFTYPMRSVLHYGSYCWKLENPRARND